MLAFHYYFMNKVCYKKEAYRSFPETVSSWWLFPMSATESTDGDCRCSCRPFVSNDDDSRSKPIELSEKVVQYEDPSGPKQIFASFSTSSSLSFFRKKNEQIELHNYTLKYMSLRSHAEPKFCITFGIQVYLIKLLNNGLHNWHHHCGCSGIWNPHRHKHGC